MLGAMQVVIVDALVLIPWGVLLLRFIVLFFYTITTSYQLIH